MNSKPQAKQTHNRETRTTNTTQASLLKLVCRYERAEVGGTIKFCLHYAALSTWNNEQQKTRVKRHLYEKKVIGN